MTDRNGTGVRVLSLGDLSPRTQPIVEIVRNGATIVLDGYMEGRRCPGLVKVALSAAADPVRELADDAPVGEQEAAYLFYHRSRLMAVIKGLEFAEADVIAGDVEWRTQIMRDLGWELDPAGAADDSPEAVGEASPSTGADSSPDAALSTSSARKSSSK